MSIEKQKVISSIQILASGIVLIKYDNRLVEDGKTIHFFQDDRAIYPGDDFSAEDQKIQSYCVVAHTPEVIASFKAMNDTSKAEV